MPLQPHPQVRLLFFRQLRCQPSQPILYGSQHVSVSPPIRSTPLLMVIGGSYHLIRESVSYVT